MKKFARPHVPEEELHAYADNQVSGGQRAEIAEHMTGCLICRAQYAEVRELRARTTEILALAVPKIPAALQATEPAAATSPRGAMKGQRGAMIAAAALVTMVGTWMVQQDGTMTAARAALANVFVAPALSASSIGTAATATAPLTPEAPVGQVALDSWRAISWEDAVRLNGGAVSRLADYPIVAVRVADGTRDARPTIMVRQQLPDGRSVWVVEGTPERVGTVTALLAATGLAVSPPLPAPRRPASTALGPPVVTIAAFTTPDSVQAIADRLRTQ